MLIQVVTLVIIVLLVIGLMGFLIVEIVHTTNENAKKRHLEKIQKANDIKYNKPIKRRY